MNIGEVQPPLIDDPIAIFNSLRRTKEMEKLWDAQKEVLNKYYAKLVSSPRLAIQLPTGSGKSIIGIIIAEAWRRKGKRVALLTSTKALTEDMKNKCDALGLEVESVIIGGRSQSDDENRQRLRNVKSYKRGLAIGIFNYWSYMMARDVEDADLLVIDDADKFRRLPIGPLQREDTEKFRYLVSNR